MAHARRHFMEARQSDVPLTDHALKMFQQLYAIEARIKDLALEGADKLRLRADEAVPILKAMKQWLAEEYVTLRPTSAIAKAMAYSLPRMDMLTIYTTDARLNIDNNPVGAICKVGDIIVSLPINKRKKRNLQFCLQ